jgi:protein LTV1
MTRRKNIFSVRNANARHFRLVHRPVGEEGENGGEALKFEDMFEEFDPHGIRGLLAKRLGEDTEVVEATEYYEDEEEEEMVDLDDLDAEFDKYAEYIDIEGESDGEHVKPVLNEEKVGEAAKYGILFDDRAYDYTKHLRSVGVTPGAVLINAPGSSKKVSEKQPFKNENFFSDEKEVVEDDEQEDEFIDPILIEANRRAREEYRALIEKASNDPTLKEVLEALEDDRYCVEGVEDDLVLSLDQLNLEFEESDTFEEEEEEIDIMGEEEEEEVDITGEDTDLSDDFDKVMLEYEESDYQESERSYPNTGAFLSEDFDEVQVQELTEEDAAEVLRFLRESGRARGTQVYEKKRSSHLPPLHIAIAQYDEVRRDLSVNREFILEKYGSKGEEELKGDEAREEKELQSMFSVFNRKEVDMKDLNIESAKWFISQEAPTIVPQVIIEETKGQRKQQRPERTLSPDNSEPMILIEKINKGQARAADETLEEKKARKAQIKAEKREKRALKSKT